MWLLELFKWTGNESDWAEYRGTKSASKSAVWLDIFMRWQKVWPAAVQKFAKLTGGSVDFAKKEKDKKKGGKEDKDKKGGKDKDDKGGKDKDDKGGKDKEDKGGKGKEDKGGKDEEDKGGKDKEDKGGKDKDGGEDKSGKDEEKGICEILSAQF